MESKYYTVCLLHIVGKELLWGSDVEVSVMRGIVYTHVRPECAPCEVEIHIAERSRWDGLHDADNVVGETVTHPCIEIGRVIVGKRRFAAGGTGYSQYAVNTHGLRRHAL